MARDVRLIEVAKERGAAELPPTDASTPDAIEQKIIQFVESEWSWQGGELINNLRAYAQRLVGYSVQSEFTNLQIASKDTLANLYVVPKSVPYLLSNVAEANFKLQSSMVD